MHVSRWSLAAVVAIVVATTGSAAAQVPSKVKRPRLAILDRGDQVEVVVSDVKLPAAPVMRVNRERIELPLAGRPVEVNDSYPFGLVMRIDVRGEGPQKSLSVKLRRDHDAVAALAKGALARQDADGVHLFVPKTAAAALVAASVPVPVPVPVPASAAATMAPTAALPGTTVTINGITEPAVEDAPVEAKSAATTAATTNAATPAAPQPATETDDAKATATVAGMQTSGTGTGTGTGTGSTANAKPIKLTGGTGGPQLGRVVVAVGAIGLAGLAIVMLRRRRGLSPTATGPQLEILASKSLGGKHRVVWLGAGERELVIAVGGPRVELLGQWPRTQPATPAALPAGEPAHDALPAPSMPLRLDAHDDLEPSFAAGSTSIPRTRTLNARTPAVAGLMRLRNRLPQVSDDVATGDTDADEQWARDILAASGARR